MNLCELLLIIYLMAIEKNQLLKAAIYLLLVRDYPLMVTSYPFCVLKEKKNENIVRIHVESVEEITSRLMPPKTFIRLMANTN